MLHHHTFYSVLHCANLIVRESSLASSICMYGKVCACNRDSLFMYCYICHIFLQCTALRQPLSIETSLISLSIDTND